MVFTVIDIETTGLSKNRHKITEIGAVRVWNGEIVKKYQTLINPGTHIPSFITRLTGIDDEMVKDAPTIKQVLPSFTKFLREDVFVAHNATFDYGFLNFNLQTFHNQLLENHRLCTRKMANRLYPQLNRKRLVDVCEHLNINNTQAHRALGDASATAEVLTNMLGALNDKGISKVEDILKFEKSPIRRI